jgi:predicted ATP-grasp superfamily ATP-dependent carboligase
VPHKSSTPSYFESDNIIFVKAITQIKKKRKRRKRSAIKATKSLGSLKANIIIGNDDAAKIAEANKKSGFLKTARVVIITEGAVGGIEGYLMNENLHRASWH